MSNRLKRLKLNSLIALCYQAVLVITGFILPRCYLYFYGSEVNGLITSITQFLAFVNICDLGISAVVSSAYYKPLADGDTVLISKIFVYSKRFFGIIGFILTGYLAVLLFVYPTVINDSFDFLFTFLLIAAMGISQLGQYFIGIAYQLLLNADQKSYIQLIINGITLIANTAVSVILMCCGANIQAVKLVSSIIYLLRPLIMRLYVKCHYNIDYSVPVDGSVVTQKKSGIIQHIAYVIYENTDVMILTMFSSLKNVSIYSVYTLVTGGIKQIINAAITGVQALLGDMLAKKEQKALTEFFSFFSWGIHTVSTVLFTVTGMLIIPFVTLYTSNINDADYNTPVFAVLITVAYFLSGIRSAGYLLIRAAGHYRQTQAASVAEAMINLIVSVICVFKYGLVGVAFGTIVATVYFIIYELYYFSKNIVFIPLSVAVKQFAVDALTAAISIFATLSINIFNGTVISWLIQAIAVTSVCCAICLFVQVIFYPANLKRIKSKPKGVK